MPVMGTVVMSQPPEVSREGLADSATFDCPEDAPGWGNLLVCAEKSFGTLQQPATTRRFPHTSVHPVLAISKMAGTKRAREIIDKKSSKKPKFAKDGTASSKPAALSKPDLEEQDSVGFDDDDDDDDEDGEVDGVEDVEDSMVSVENGAKSRDQKKTSIQNNPGSYHDCKISPAFVVDSSMLTHHQQIQAALPKNLMRNRKPSPRTGSPQSQTRI